MNKFIKFMASPAGRILRIIAGSSIIAWGMINMEGTTRYITLAVGLLPVLTGILNICIVGPLIGAPLKGSKT